MNDNEHNFIGMDGFLWFYGVVEDRNDPYLIGRVKVRCFGHHTGNKTDLPTEDLPWAHVILPVTSAGISGIGHSPTGLVEGSHVFGFFRDGEARQEPVVMGSCPGYPAEKAKKEKGFYDPNGKYPTYINAPDTSQLATMVTYNPDFHPSMITDNEFINNSFQNIGVCTIEFQPVASAFISRGSSSLFGIATDFITGAVSNILGGNILGSLGGTLGSASKILGGLNELPQKGIDFLTNTLDIDASAITRGIQEKVQYGAGVLDFTFDLDENIPFSKLADAGLKSAGINPVTGQFTYKIISPTTLDLLGLNSAPVEQVNNFLKAQADPTKNEFDLVNTLGIRPASEDTKENQDTEKAKIDTDMKNQGGTSSQKGLNYLRDRDGNIIEVVDNEYHNIDVKQKEIGDQGQAIRQLKKFTEARLEKIINDFIAPDLSSWSMPTLPKPSDTYPKRHVYETESGHYKLYDDTENERTTIERHASGTLSVVTNEGTKTDVTVADHILGISGSVYQTIGEHNIVHIKGGQKVLVNANKSDEDNNFDIEIAEGANGRIQVNKGNYNINVIDGKINLTCSDLLDILVKDGDINVIGKRITFNATDEFRVEAPKIFLN